MRLYFYKCCNIMNTLIFDILAIKLGGRNVKIVKLMLSLGIILCISATQGFAAEKRYKVKSGIIEYQQNSAQVQGTETLYWTDYGQREARYQNTTTHVFGMKNTVNSVNILDKDLMYSYDPGTKTGNVINYKDMMETVTGQQSPREFGEAMLKAYDAVKIGQEKILGKKCDVYEMRKLANSKVWIYKNIPLKTETNMMGMSFNMVATSFKENASVAHSKFEVPSDVKIVEQDISEFVGRDGEPVNPEDMQEAMKAMNEMQNSPEIQEAMKQMQQFQEQMANSPEMQEAFQKMQEMKQNPSSYQQNSTSSSTAADSTLGTRAVEGAKEEASDVVEEEVREKTRKGMKKLFGSALKSVF